MSPRNSILNKLSTFSALPFASGSVLLGIPDVRTESIWYVINILVWLNLMCHFFRNANGEIWASIIAWGGGSWGRRNFASWLPQMTLPRESFLLLPSHKISPTYQLCINKQLNFRKRKCRQSQQKIWRAPGILTRKSLQSLLGFFFFFFLKWKQMYMTFLRD